MDEIEKFIKKLEVIDDTVNRLDGDLHDLQNKEIYGGYALRQRISKLEKKLDCLFNTMMKLHADDFIKALETTEKQVELRKTTN